MRGIVPIEAGSRLGLLEADVLRWFAAGHGVEGFKPVSFDLVHVKKCDWPSSPVKRQMSSIRTLLPLPY
jgi:hypothetical protein